MNLMELGAIGELVGGVAVVVTLAYLAHNYASALFSYFEALFYAQQAGNVDREIWQSRVFRMRAMFGFDAFVSAWDERKIGFGKSFQDFIDREIAGNPIDIFESSRERALAERKGRGEENEP